MPTPSPAQPNRQQAPASEKLPSSPSAQHTQRPSDSVPMATGSFAKLPMRFGRYQIEKLLGKGNMGAVYLAKDTQLGRKVAIKIPKLSAGGSPKLLKRLQTEAMAAAQIDHPCVCPVYDSGDIDGIPYIAMQYIEGETLKDHLEKVSKAPQEAVDLVVHLAEGLSEAHTKKIYHRDLKPENIKLNRRGLPVIMDFGLAKLATTLKSDAGATQAGTTLGTPVYMSPEQANGQVTEIDHRSDIYALGVILFELLTGKWPFTGSSIQVMAQKTMHEAPSPLELNAELPPQLAAVCRKMIARNREDRYASAKEVIAALKAIDLRSAPPLPQLKPAPSQAASLAIETGIPQFEDDGERLSSIIGRQRTGGSGAYLRKAAGRQTNWLGPSLAVVLLALLGLWTGGVFDQKVIQKTNISAATEKRRFQPREDHVVAAPTKIVSKDERHADPEKKSNDKANNAIVVADNVSVPSVATGVAAADQANTATDEVVTSKAHEEPERLFNDKKPVGDDEPNANQNERGDRKKPLTKDKRTSRANVEPKQYGIKNADFSSGLEEWEVEGGAKSFRVFKSDFVIPDAPDNAKAVTTYGKSKDADTGRLFQKFYVPRDAAQLEFYVSGGKGPDVYIALTYKEQGYRVAGQNNHSRAKVVWDLSEVRGKLVTLEIVDASTGRWGFIAIEGIRILSKRDLKRGFNK